MALALYRGIIRNLSVSSVKSIYNFFLSSGIPDGLALLFSLKKNYEGKGCVLNFPVLVYCFFLRRM